MKETQFELTGLRCPRCAGQLVVRVLAEERGAELALSIDSACVACGISPWAAPDQRTVYFTPGGPGSVTRARASETEQALREEISRLEGELAAARAEIRRTEEATRGEVAPGKRPIEVE